MRFVSYNIHRAIGASGSPSIRAIGGVLRGIDPHVVGLQEVVRTPVIADQPARLARMLAAERAFLRTARSHGMPYGIATLVRGWIAGVRALRLPSDGEPRAALFCDMEVGDARFVFGVTHFDPRPAERAAQSEALAAAVQAELAARPATPLVLAGDFNARPDELTPLLAHLELASPQLTYPAPAPTASLDHVLHSSHWRVEGASSVASTASDHAALVVDLELLR